MVTDYKISRLVDYDLLSFLKDMGCTATQFKLLCFWGRHPKAKLSLYTMARALDTSAINLRNEITGLVEKAILTAKRNGDGLTTYALSDRESQGYIDELGNLDWNQLSSLGRELKEETVEGEY